MDEHSIERIRKADFPLAVRGYDRTAVDRFLDELADWLQTGGGEEATRIEAVRLELERIGEQTSGILTEAHAAAQGIRDDASAEVRQQLAGANLTADSVRTEAQEYAADTRDEADAYARRIRAEADEYASETRGDAEAEMDEDRESARKEAERIVADANRRKGEIEKMIADLEERRDAVLAELERLATGIAGTATQHRSPKAEAAQADPAEEEDQTTVLAQDAS